MALWWVSKASYLSLAMEATFTKGGGRVGHAGMQGSCQFEPSSAQRPEPSGKGNNSRA